jgi:hypothetical protein
MVDSPGVDQLLVLSGRHAQNIGHQVVLQVDIRAALIVVAPNGICHDENGGARNRTSQTDLSHQVPLVAILGPWRDQDVLDL